ncbi:MULTISPECIES: hypothetical protein [unclassified Modicisalibacter]|uniref:hypothetical protein n=1 Tax=unclassified Modicisalibacter TaxID=2679913 RepID=UPI001CCD96DD|nr:MULTISPECIES: hypothetical protein [unclassified Modicisalibacter]MBZ9559476.1 hypothetical protein [Modicisalibacter sp. R2A 31.J]MBZ9576928.1 hypothetical protein [Modicisalibacter sp. MOD 31.J]
MKIGSPFYPAPRATVMERTTLAARADGTGPTPSTSLPGRTEETAPNPVAERLQELQDGLQRLQAMPREVDENKADFLMQRLEMLKALMMFASPNKLAAIAKELKSIAGELNGLARNLGGGTGAAPMALPSPTLGATQTTPEVVDALTGAQLTLGAEAPLTSVDGATAPGEPTATPPANLTSGRTDDTTPGSAGTQEATDDDKPSASTVGPGTSALPSGQPSESASGARDGALLGLLKDAKKSLSEAIAQLRAATDEENRDGKKALRQAEKQLAGLDRTLARSVLAGFYSELSRQPSDMPSGRARFGSIDIAI